MDDEDVEAQILQATLEEAGRLALNELQSDVAAPGAGQMEAVPDGRDDVEAESAAVEHS
jgi:hypothetical protein